MKMIFEKFDQQLVGSAAAKDAIGLEKTPWKNIDFEKDAHEYLARV